MTGRKYVLGWIVVISVGVGVALAQAPPTSQPTASQQELIMAAAEAESLTARDLQLAQARHQAAQAKTLQIIYQVMAELKLSPTEYAWKAEGGKLVFVKLPEKKGGDKP